MANKILKTHLGFEREKLMAPFGFKGAHINELWQVSVLLQDEDGNEGLGVGVQSVLWSDSAVCAQYSPSAGNSVMLLLTEYAITLLKGQTMKSPIEMLEDIIPEVHRYGKMITGNQNLRKTFVLNALVPVDMALWRLHAEENKITFFDDLVPDKVKPWLQGRQKQLAAVPLITYGVSPVNVGSLAQSGMFFMKIKIGSDPERDNDREKMLQWDCERISTIHNILKDFRTPYTDSGKIPYYLDANGRYDSSDRVMRLFDHIDKIGALDQIIILEEPFTENSGIDVSKFPTRIVADESVHDADDVDKMVQLGYTGIALKPIAKTLSMSFDVLERAGAAGIPTFCADLTVNPLMVDWNKNVAARLACLPGMKVGVIESNGNQNYTNWNKMKNYHPMGWESWVDSSNGVFGLDKNFYRYSGGIFAPTPHYREMAVLQ